MSTSRARTSAAVAAAPTRPSRGFYGLALGYGRLIYRVRWIILALWLGGLIASVPFAASIASVLKGGFSYGGGESGRAASALFAQLHWPRSEALVVFQSSATPVNDPSYQAEIQGFTARLGGFPHLTGVTSGPIGQDGRSTFVALGFDLDASAVSPYIPALRRLLPSGSATGPARAYLTGEPAVEDEVLSLSQQDAEHAEAATMPIALVLLLIVFGTLIAAAMPLSLALVAVPVALAVIYAIAVHHDTTIFVENIGSIVGLGISIDYSLLMTRRFREELHLGRDVRDAVARTVATTGEAILFSGLCVTVGFCGLFLIGLDITSSIALGGVVVVGCAVLAALTFLPALLGVLGHRIDALGVPILHRRVPRQAAAGGTGVGAGRSTGAARVQEAGRWHAWALAVMRRPVLAIVAVIAVLVLLGWPITALKLAWYGSSGLPSTIESQRGLAILKAQLPQAAQTPVYVVVQTPDGSSMLSAPNLAHLAMLTQWLATQPHVTATTGLLQPPPTPGTPAIPLDQLAALYSSGAYQQQPALAQLAAATTASGTSVITVDTNAAVDSDAGKALIATLRAGDRAQAGGLSVLVGGLQAQSVDLIDYAYGNFPRAILFTLAATFCLLLLMFRSLLLPLKAVLMNLLSLAAAYGVLIYVFQWGNFAQVLDFHSQGFLDAIIPIVIFAILFGLSMDYEVFLLSRVHEEWLRTRNNRNAVARGLEKTGGVITNAALLFVTVTAAFTFSSVLQTKEMGLGMTVAVLVDASIIRTLLVPATMRLLGRWNWWLPGQPVPARSARPAGALDPDQFGRLAARSDLSSEELAALRRRLLSTYLADILPGMSAEVEAAVAPGSELLHYAPGETIIRQGDEADRFYVITHGECDILRELGDGRETLAGRLTNGEYFGEIGLLQGSPRTATVRAAADSEVEVIAIDREAFGSLMAGSGLASDDIAGVMRKRLLELASLGDQ